MRRLYKLTLLLSLLLSLATVRASNAQDAPLLERMQFDGRLTTFQELIQVANLGGMLGSPGPYTIFVPTNQAFAKLSPDFINHLKNTPNDARTVVLFHVVPGDIGTGDFIGQNKDLKNALSQNVNVSSNNGTLLNWTARPLDGDITAANGRYHVIDGVMIPYQLRDLANSMAAGQPAPTAAEGAAPAAGETPAAPIDEFKLQPLPGSGDTLVDPAYNNVFHGYDRIPYWRGITIDSSVCRGMTWIVLKQADGVTLVGADRKSNPYRGDTPCSSERSLLCFNRNSAPPPGGSSIGANYYDGWAFGRVAATQPIAGSRLSSRDVANRFCESTFGAGWRMAEFHDGGAGSGTGQVSGWDFWAQGTLELGRRYWVHIGDQPGNPWDSIQPFALPNQPPGLEILNPNLNPAYTGLGYTRPGGGRSGCRGMTWLVLRQVGYLVQVGADRTTNPYIGDTSCSQTLPVLCIRVLPYRPPANNAGLNFSEGWSSGVVRLTGIVSGDSIGNRDRANRICSDAFGSGWRIANFHDGSLGTGHTEGWSFWAYGGLPLGQRFWVAVHDQPGNPWNQ